ncbi:Branched-chain amino acid ABC superfamily ATP binding cassette transporter, ABC protein [Lactobacillus equicursoris DSM 19284 = JCM 14600 = CIP 110162]|uniref:Branched-chain amino acid ABC superfamily ATP binding cassette transporter, ABC protein n=1 Tax=Lactobacillus equicursoris 66c TaxID=872326 RepID=K0NX63_9LACO|nr:ABC transporter ATP-binding protein [Lactobacillus equicursoris]CCK84015.1 Branched-chain amino acid ABC superfamily ATP binding cassette transporter, ABC protein [Lactobacillus equicursoris 66c]CCK84813.1 Branched-chain amino acid ABC superfamily ATP binding cassette transporter, ABC protein [Lactobacillus equicursoris DSM 19284 = JCM 14600 = CIP 110162]
MTEALSADHITKVFGGLTAVDDVSLHVNEKELVALIGPNGAGKTTFFNCLTGVAPATSGVVKIGGQEVKKNTKAYKVAQMGISRTFQNIRLFSQLSVLENILIAMTNQFKEGFLTSVFRLPSFYKTEDEMEEKAIALLKDFNLQDVMYYPAGDLPYGTQRKVEIVRALATKPKIICLDEPAAGMNPEETADLTRLIKRLQTEYGIAVLLIEHDMSLVMNLAERIYVLAEGKLLAKGTPEEIQNNQAVIDAYLGGGVDA